VTVLEDIQDLRTVITLSQASLASALQARNELVVALVSEGVTMRAAADASGISFQRVSQLVKASRANAWGPLREWSAGDELQTARQAFTAARHAQDLRAEHYGMGYREETAAFYGSDKVAACDEAESRIGWAGFHVGLSAQSANVA
jgi:transcriptional regulator with XRE-family HTH domain